MFLNLIMTCLNHSLSAFEVHLRAPTWALSAYSLFVLRCLIAAFLLHCCCWHQIGPSAEVHSDSYIFGFQVRFRHQKGFLSSIYGCINGYFLFLTLQYELELRLWFLSRWACSLLAFWISWMWHQFGREIFWIECIYLDRWSSVHKFWMILFGFWLQFCHIWSSPGPPETSLWFSMFVLSHRRCRKLQKHHHFWKFEQEVGPYLAST